MAVRPAAQRPGALSGRPGRLCGGRGREPAGHIRRRVPQPPARGAARSHSRPTPGVRAVQYGQQQRQQQQLSCRRAALRSGELGVCCCGERRNVCWPSSPCVAASCAELTSGLARHVCPARQSELHTCKLIHSHALDIHHYITTLRCLRLMHILHIVHICRIIGRRVLRPGLASLQQFVDFCLTISW